MRGIPLMRRITFWLGAVLLTPLLVVVGSEALADPGGWRGVALIAAWLVPLAALIVLARRSPEIASPTLVALTAAFVTFNVWYELAPADWREFESGSGPVRAVALLALTAALLVHGLRRTELAALLLLACGAVAVAMPALDDGAPRSLIVASIPAMLLGTLYLVAALFGDQQQAAPGNSNDRPRQPAR